MTRYQPQFKQQIAHDCPADEILYGGAAGGGKTAWLLNEAIAVCREEPGASCILFRRTFPELGKIVRDSRVQILKNEAELKQKDYLWTFHNVGANGKPSILRFGHLNEYDDIHKYQGDEFDWIGFDEGTHFIPDMGDRVGQITYLISRNRTTLPDGWPRIRIASNPGNIGHKWMLEKFVRPTGEARLLAYFDFDAGGWRAYPPGTRGKVKPYVVWRPDTTEEYLSLGVEPRTRCFIPATVEDNRYIDAGYKAALLALPETKKNALLYGDWDSYEGQFFAEFKIDTHVVDPISPPSHWRKWRALDWGYADPLACLWLTINPENNQVIVYRELYRSGLHDAEATSLIKSMTPDDEHIDFTIADPTMWRGDSNNAALTKAMIYQQHGVPLLPGTNARVDGWARLRDLFAINPETQQPGLVITRNCDRLIDSIPTLVHSDSKPEDLEDKGADSHGCDALRYACMSRGSIAPRKAIPIHAGRFRV